MDKTYFKKAFLLCLAFSPLLSFGQGCIGKQGQVKWHYWLRQYNSSFQELYSSPNFPDRPDGVEIIGTVQSPTNYANAYGSYIHGYIKIPTTASVTFNITGDDRVRFLLSTSDQTADLVELAYSNSFTQSMEHDKHPEQTSAPVTLVGGLYYYFEVHHMEGGGGDHVSVWWKSAFLNTTEWTPIGGNFIYEFGCTTESCYVQGSFCQDNNPQTADDQFDGQCHCVGQPASANPCIGERGVVKLFRYEGINGSNLSALYLSPIFPASPSTSLNMEGLHLGDQNSIDNYGTLGQGFLTVPISGLYRFNLTGNNETRFYLSSNDSPTLKDHISLHNRNSSGSTEHEKYAEQSSAWIQLNANQYYYFELHHKEGSGNEHFSVFWQTPWQQTQWKRISAFYCYGYACTLACIPEGTSCDDGQLMTKNDVINDLCECEGVPCEVGDCNDPIADYVPYEKCNITDLLDTSEEGSWESCTASNAPNNLRGMAHWIQYDLGIVHKIFTSQFWNYNVSGQVNKGFQQVKIDYSVDGISWVEFGSYTWPLATGDPSYAGFDGPNFYGVEARYILISTNQDLNTCKGIGKVAFYTRPCLSSGTDCDDGNPATHNDQFDDNCNCTGVKGNPNDCLFDILTLGDSILTSNIYHALTMVESKSSVVPNMNISMKAGEEVVLLPGFRGEVGSSLEILIGDCPEPQSLADPIKFKAMSKQILEAAPLTVRMHEYRGESYVRIQYILTQPGSTRLEIVYDQQKASSILLEFDVAYAGMYTKLVPARLLPSGEWTVLLTTEQSKYELRPSELKGNVSNEVKN